jgi:omega-6 fatty acid desaturase (delta-12 desaturase)
MTAIVCSRSPEAKDPFSQIATLANLAASLIKALPFRCPAPFLQGPNRGDRKGGLMETIAQAGSESASQQLARSAISRDMNCSELRRAARDFASHCAAFKSSDVKRSLFQLAVTVIPFFAICVAMLFFFERAWLVSALLAIPAAGFVIRLFIIQHDCGHGSYFKSRSANDFLGRFISIFTLTPYECWRQLHARHHATSGDLDRRGAGDIDTLTVREYLALPWYRRLFYRVYRHPAFILLLGPPLHFFVRQRVPLMLPVSNIRSRNSIMLTNLGLMIFYGGLIGVFGARPVLFCFVPVWILAAWIGGWLFFVQHQFEETTWDAREEWDFHVAAILGSSHYDLPAILQWFTGNIGLHHVHHVCAQIPNYRLQECAETAPVSIRPRRLTLLESLKCVNLALWDEEKRQLVSFGQISPRAAT